MELSCFGFCSYSKTGYIRHRLKWRLGSVALWMDDGLGDCLNWESNGMKIEWHKTPGKPFKGFNHNLSSDEYLDILNFNRSSSFCSCHWSLKARKPGIWLGLLSEVLASAKHGISLGHGHAWASTNLDLSFSRLSNLQLNSRDPSSDRLPVWYLLCCHRAKNLVTERSVIKRGDPLYFVGVI